MADHIYRTARVPRVLTPFPASEDPLVDCDLTIREGRIAEVRQSSDPAHDLPSVPTTDLNGRLVLPGFVDAHVHLDKAFTWDRAPNPRGEFWDAIEALSQDKENWTEEDLYRRGTFALQCATAHGTVAMRTHVDTGPDFGVTSHAVMDQLRRDWRDKITLQTVSLCSLEQYDSKAGERIAEQTLAYPDAFLGGMPQMGPHLGRQLDRFFGIAQEHQVGVDLHVDENGDPAAECLRHIAETVLRRQFKFPVTCGHVCSLAVQTPERAASTIDLVRAAGIKIISLPLCNLYLQGRRTDGGKRLTPHWRGLTLLNEWVEAGVVTACASDNVRDAFYAWGDFDLFEVLTQSVRIGHLDSILDQACAMVTKAPAQILGLGTSLGQVAPGYDARLIAFEARSFNELLSRPSQPRRRLHFSVENSPPPYPLLVSRSAEESLPELV
jgi:cytosine/creatinine deaminase